MAERETISPTTTASKLTYEDYVDLPDDDRRYEILDGELTVTPSPRTSHQIVSRNLVMILELHVRARDLGTVLPAPVDVILDNTTVVVPDIVFVSKDRRQLITERAVEGAPDLIVEILSKSTERRDRGAKSKLYARFGVGYYWIVNAEEKTIELRRLAHDGYEAEQTCKGHDVVVPTLFPELRLELADVWKT